MEAASPLFPPPLRTDLWPAAAHALPASAFPQGLRGFRLSRGAVTSLLLHGGLLAALLLVDPGEASMPMPQLLPVITVSLVAAPAPAPIAAPAPVPALAPAPAPAPAPAVEAARSESAAQPAEPPQPEPVLPLREAEPEPQPLPKPLPQPAVKPKPPVAKQPASPKPPADPAPAQLAMETATQPATQPATEATPAALALAAPHPAPIAASPAPAVAMASDEPPVLHHARFRRPPTPPAYPPRARTLEQEGVSVIRALIDPDGVSREVRLWRSSGHQLLDQAALNAVRGWAFEAARLGDRPVLAWVEIPVRFEIR